VKWFIPKEWLGHILYNLTYEEVEIIDPQVGSIISKQDFEKIEPQ
jgi:hypothetical protein